MKEVLLNNSVDAKCASSCCSNCSLQIYQEIIFVSAFHLFCLDVWGVVLGVCGASSALMYTASLVNRLSCCYSMGSMVPLAPVLSMPNTSGLLFQTAEMPGFYASGEYDVAGFAVGSVHKDKVIDGTKIADGDVLLGLKSTGVHSNGFSLVRKVLEVS